MKVMLLAHDSADLLQCFAFLAIQFRDDISMHFPLFGGRPLGLADGAGGSWERHGRSTQKRLDITKLNEDRIVAV